MFRLSFTLAIIIFSCHTQAQTNYYQCTDRWGQPVFSQKPCGVDAKKTTVKSQERISTDSVLRDKAPRGTESNVSATRESSGSSWDKVTASRKLREATREIDRRGKKIDRLESERDTKIAALKRKQGYANNNLAGAQYLESLATEMQAVNSQYAAKILSEQRKIDRLLDASEK